MTKAKLLGIEIVKIDKDGNERKNKWGNPSPMVKIAVDGIPGRISAFLDKASDILEVESWQIGQMVEIETYTSKDGKWTNFRLPTIEDKLIAVAKDHEKRIKALEDFITGKDKEPRVHLDEETAKRISHAT